MAPQHLILDVIYLRSRFVTSTDIDVDYPNQLNWSCRNALLVETELEDRLSNTLSAHFARWEAKLTLKLTWLLRSVHLYRTTKHWF
jgi:hypothetical protein